MLTGKVLVSIEVLYITFSILETYGKCNFQKIVRDVIIVKAVHYFKPRYSLVYISFINFPEIKDPPIAIDTHFFG